MSSNTDNVILFNKNFKKASGSTAKQEIAQVDPVKAMEKIDEKITELKVYHAHEFLDYYVKKVFDDLSIAGFDFNEFYDEQNRAPPHIHKLECFLMETIRSTIFYYQGINHPFQKLAEGLFVHDPKDESYQLLNAIYINFNVSNKKPRKPRKKKTETKVETPPVQ